MYSENFIAISLALLSWSASASPTQVIRRATTTFATVPPSSTSTDPHDQFDPSVVKNVTCTSKVAIPKSNQQIAELLVCNGIQTPITNCEHNLTSTTSTSGTAKWTLTAPAGGAQFNFFKGSWEECANAARAACPDQTFKGTCLGGVTQGEGFTFELTQA